MGAPERKLINKTLASLPENKRLFRINAGSGWQGEIVKKDKNFITLKNPRIFRGAPDGWPDLAGWETIEITPEMVGQKIAVFVAEEVKATGGLSKIQKMFRDVLVSMGGVFRVVEG